MSPTGAYERAGVNYDQLDALKRFAQMTACETEGNLPPGMSVVQASREEWTLIRDVVAKLPEGYRTKLPSGRMLHEALLTRTHIYARLQQELFAQGIDIHYMAHVTGYGWRKLMRAEPKFTYRMHAVPEPQEELLLIQKAGNISDKEMYGTFNMGAGFAFMVPVNQSQDVVEICAQQGFRAWDAGVVEEGPKQVIIEPKDISFSADTLAIR